MKNPSETETLDQLDDLANGQLGLLAAWRLNRRIRRDSNLAREWDDVRSLRDRLGNLALASPVRKDVSRASETITMGRFSMKKSAVAFAVGWLVFLSVTGAVAMRFDTNLISRNEETTMLMDERWVALADYYQRPQRVTADEHSYQYQSLPDLVGALEIEDLPGQPKCLDHHLVWKTYGDVHVIAKLHGRREMVDETNDPDYGAKKKYYPVAERTVIDELESEQVVAKEDLDLMPREYRCEVMACRPVAHVVPVTYWQLGDSSGWVDQRTGRFAHVLRSGKFDGYGHFVIHDAQGKALMALDVSRPRKHHRLTLAPDSDRVKRQKVVPGWDGEE